jgi:hypothetical protein
MLKNRWEIPACNQILRMVSRIGLGILDSRHYLGPIDPKSFVSHIRLAASNTPIDAGGETTGKVVICARIDQFAETAG